MIVRFREFYPRQIDVSHHWSPLSQCYAGVDTLLGRLDTGWKIQGDIDFDEHHFGESRHVIVYHFVLSRRDKRVTMHVLHNPVLERLLAHYHKKITSAAGAVDKPDTDSANNLHGQVTAFTSNVNVFSS
jgi:hypothetical protein